MSSESASVHPTSVVSPDAVLGTGVRIGAFCSINPNVTVGDGTFVESHTVLGAPTADFYADPASYQPKPCSIGPGGVIRSHSVLYADVEIGGRFDCGHHVTVREGSRIAEGVRVGTYSDLQGNLNIGRYARIHSNVFVSQLSTVEEFAWLFPHVLLANDPHPPSDTCTSGPTIRRFAVVSARAVVFPGVEIGEGALVGAMALVREDVPPMSVAVGVPARIVGSTGDIRCQEGRLDQVYPWWTHFRRGFPEGILPALDEPPASGA